MAASIPKRDQPVKHYFTGKQHDHDGSKEGDDAE